MGRILIVEDEVPILGQLKELFCEALPGFRIDTADSISRALEEIERTLKEGRTYEAVVLDMRLPLESGGADIAEVDDHICKELRKTMQNVLVFHISAYGRYPDVKAHIAELHADPKDPGSKLISKKDSSWPLKLLVLLKAYLYGKPIEKQLDELFGTEEQLRLARQGRPPLRRPGRRPCGTIALERLRCNVGRHWNDLSPELKERILKFLTVKAEEDGYLNVELNLERE